jgi:hypothetical protein
MPPPTSIGNRRLHRLSGIRRVLGSPMRHRPPRTWTWWRLQWLSTMKLVGWRFKVIWKWGTWWKEWRKPSTIHNFMVHLPPIMKVVPSIIEAMHPIIKVMPSTVKAMTPIIKMRSPIVSMVSSVMTTILTTLRIGRTIIPRLCSLFWFRWVWELIRTWWMRWWMYMVCAIR